ncbi:MAG: acetyl-CoA carboxylase biotin carboxyl carrier protein subunit [Lawsonella sp.]|nr:acetyl-CoA carboxylase biotin carboxyl carrier protein subunit [Mycobacteriales bacterium]
MSTKQTPVQITAPLAGIWRKTVDDGAAVAEGQVIGYVEAIKLDAAVTAPAAGTIRFIVTEDFSDVSGGDLLAELH